MLKLCYKLRKVLDDNAFAAQLMLHIYYKCRNTKNVHGFLFKGCRKSVEFEFYCRFWNPLGKLMVDSLNYAFQTGQLSISQRLGIILLIPKKDKNLDFLKNWRTVTLLNTDYKIATKAITMRLEKV